MDREKAADLLDNLIGMVEDNHGADYDTALKMGIEALSTSGDGPEPVDDTISRQAAIDAVKKNTFRLTFAEEQNCEGHVAWSANAVYSDVIEGKLLGLPSAQPEQQWIPCNWHKDTENLPDECKSVLICIKDKIGMYVDVSYRTDYNRWERYGRNVNVVAWRELPEPWRGEEHETD